MGGWFSYHSTLRILCEAFQIEPEGHDVRCERRLIAEARRLNTAGKMLAPIIDDAHLMDVTALRKIRLLFEDFPKNHCLVLVAQPELLQNLTLTVNEDLKNRVTYSVLLKKLAPTTSPTSSGPSSTRPRSRTAPSPTTRSASSCAPPKAAYARREISASVPCSKPCATAPKASSSKQVNRVLLQPHWRKEADLPH